jgi:hypothetical protein
VLGTGLGLALIQRRLRGGESDVAALADVESDPTRREPLFLFIYSDT